ncbi:MAG TPA: Z-ring formation inhibitor MciZ [Thermoanaerobacterales bacterium]|jgi:hypothetical protein|nr:Z-ring formation inhibitor MciZ [Thermoanaerobacterales bacterium]
MEYIITTNQVFLIGTAQEIKEFLKEKAKTCKTVKDIIISESRFDLKTSCK